MDEQSRYAYGIDVGTENVRAVVLSLSKDGVGVVGYGEARNDGGMRKGVVTNLAVQKASVARAIGQAENMSGKFFNTAMVSVNGSHLNSVKTHGMVTIANGGAVTEDDIERLKDAAIKEAEITGKLPQNRSILSIVPISFTLDGQTGIQDPLGMQGVKLEMNACVVSGLGPSCASLTSVFENEEVRVNVGKKIPTVEAAARAVLTDKQVDNGVAMIDFGAATTSVAIYDDGCLRYVGVVPEGSDNITKDLAIMLKIDSSIAEEIKIKYASADFPEQPTDRDFEPITIRKGKESATFTMDQVNQVVKGRLDEIFGLVMKEIAQARYVRKLPEGAVIVGGGAKLRGLAKYVRDELELSVKIGMPGKDFIGTGVADAIEKPEFATAIGLALKMADEGGTENQIEDDKPGFFARLFRRK
ncbi:MAG: cell division protein FtsA [Candidatus Saccharibacteria bacterium]|nr:cell division protein FtsA [Candidatus Saccharibacteria bacterium]